MCVLVVLLLASVWLGWVHCHGTRRTHSLESSILLLNQPLGLPCMYSQQLLYSYVYQ